MAPQRLPTIADDQALRRTVEQLEAWRVDAAEKPGPGTHLLAYRDPVDASVQPIRLTVPPGFSSGAAVIPLVVLLRSTGPGKAQWQALPAAWSAAALAAGVAVLEVQSAGDGSWSGAALRRLPLAEAAARAAVPALGPTPLMMLAHPGLDQPSAWQRPGPVTVPFSKSPLTPTGQSEGQLTVWSTGPFVVVVGTGEHRSAAEDAAQLADAFVASTTLRGEQPTGAGIT